MNPNISKRRHAKAAAAKEAEHNHNGNGHGHHDHQEINVGDMERQLSMVGGSVLVLCGLLKGSLSGLLLAGMGGALIWRGHTGHCEMYHMLGHNTADNSEHEGKHNHPPAPEQYEGHLQGQSAQAAG